MGKVRWLGGLCVHLVGHKNNKVAHCLRPKEDTLKHKCCTFRAWFKADTQCAQGGHETQHRSHKVSAQSVDTYRLSAAQG